MAQRGVLLCGHGSRDSRAVAEFGQLAEALAGALPAGWPLAHGFLEFAQPVLRASLAELRSRGVDEILAVPGMLFAAGHAKNDIPSVLNTYAAEVGDVRVRYGRELGLAPQLLAAAQERIAAAEAELDAAHGPVAREDTCLVVIGRGASDPDANGNVAKLARLLWEGMGFGWSEIGYSGVTFPLVSPALAHAARLGYRRLIVFPYFLFTGVLVERVYGLCDEAAAAHPELQLGKAGYLGSHPQVVATFAERAQELVEGQPAMNCQLCKYRTQVLGFEAEVGMPQESHHHHVEGAGTDAGDGHSHHHHGHGHSHDHGHGRDHGHDHPPYPGADHPLGPKGYPGDVGKA